MTRDWTALSTVIIRRDIAEALKKKFSNQRLEDIVVELASEAVCVRVFNHCEKCGHEVYIFLLKEQAYETRKYEAVSNAECNDCLSTSRWKKT